MAIAYLALGTNIGNKRRNMITAAALLAERVGDVLALSGFYETEPWGFQSENTFLNAALQLETSLSPLGLLEATQQIEVEMGRTQKSNGTYHDRIIDIDILLYDDLILQTPELTLPHPLMQDRRFVMEPLLEIAPNVVHPVFKKTVVFLMRERNIL
ncbi:2-amino-4-hydroxy-6-hydroxymethyldihydropteridine diphosphokinase [Parabacteroides faecis]|uniref:2-amino-4-hydroxy-6- hydroxymethyldihydropteridine diphosphokinase n=1 Tax=Parabacteroides faecis TaxID=1217282 RepID=UPI003520AE3E